MSSDNFHDAASERERVSSAPRQPERAQPLARIASAVGNRGFTRTIARMRTGDGILPGGVVHPDVEAAIVAARGRGLPADRALANHVGAALGDSLSDVRVHRDAGAAALARSVSARAFTVGSDIFFGPGEYEPTTRRRSRAAHPRTGARRPAARRAAEWAADGVATGGRTRAGGRRRLSRHLAIASRSSMHA